jgi:hypothetical protein
VSTLTHNSKEAFESAIQEKGKYVLVLAYSGTVHPKAEEYVSFPTTF